MSNEQLRSLRNSNAQWIGLEPINSRVKARRSSAGLQKQYNTAQCLRNHNQIKIRKTSLEERYYIPKKTCLGWGKTCGRNWKALTPKTFGNDKSTHLCGSEDRHQTLIPGWPHILLPGRLSMHLLALSCAQQWFWPKKLSSNQRGYAPAKSLKRCPLTGGLSEGVAGAVLVFNFFLPFQPNNCVFWCSHRNQKIPTGI